MSMREHELESRIRDALADWPARVKRRIDGGWLELWFESPAGSGLAPAELLRRNRDLPGGVRCVPARGVHGLQFRCEVPLDLPDAARHERIDKAGAGFLSVLTGDPAVAEAAGDFCEPLAPDIQASVSEAGWTCVARGDGSLAVDLGIPDLFLQAEIESRAGAVRCAVALAPPDPVPGTANAAQALLLLRAAGAVRQVRPVLSEDSELALEVMLTVHPGSRELGHALAALALAGQMCARELEVLRQSPRIAAYVGAALAGGVESAITAPRCAVPRTFNDQPSREEIESWQRQQQR